MQLAKAVLFLQLPFSDGDLDRRVELMQEVVKTVRAMRHDYLPGARPEGELA